MIGALLFGLIIAIGAAWWTWVDEREKWFDGEGVGIMRRFVPPLIVGIAVVLLTGILASLF